MTPLGFANEGAYIIYNTTRFDRGIYVGEVWLGDFSPAGIRNPRKINIPHFKNLSPYQTGCISSDGKHILLSMEGNNTFGVEDIYVTSLQPDGTWSPLRNLGYQINTGFQEYTPFLAADNETLFFATNGREGKGSFDLYYSQRVDDTWQTWTTPVNLGDQVNTVGSEMAFVFVPEGDYGYFISTTNSDGYGDVKRIRISSDIDILSGTPEPFVVIDEEDETTRVLVLQDAITGKLVAGKLNLHQPEGVQEVESPYQLLLDEFNDITISSSLSGYLALDQLVPANELVQSDTIFIQIEPLTVGNTIQLEHVLFYRGTANFIEGSQQELDVVIQVMKDNPNMKIELQGHTDNQGDAMLNLELSRERVRVVQDYIIRGGIDFTRISGKGFGGNMPIAPNDSETNRRLNRRVEFTIVEN